MDHDINKTAREFIKEKRLAIGKTQEELSKMAFGPTAGRARINGIENGQKPITLNTLGKILKALNSDINFIEY